jgi:hypothetical protein
LSMREWQTKRLDAEFDVETLLTDVAV